MLNRLSGHTTMVFNLLDLEFSSAMVGMLLMDGLKTILLSLAPLIGMTFAMVIIVESMQTGFLFSLESLSPKFENLNPINGFKKFFALKQYIELIKSIIKMAAVGTILYYTLRIFTTCYFSTTNHAIFNDCIGRKNHHGYHHTCWCRVFTCNI